MSENGGEGGRMWQETRWWRGQGVGEEGEKEASLRRNKRKVKCKKLTQEGDGEE